MNEILQKRIDEAAKKAKTDFLNRFNWSGNQETGFKEGAFWMLNHQWISVDEALPTERDKEDEQYSTNVFARTKDCIRYAYYDFYNESWCSVEGGYRFGGDVTHWMSIPEIKGGEK